MNDNRTTELREKLDELSIEHFNYDKGGRTQTQWEAPDGKRHFTYETSDNPAKTARLVIAWHPTPEQAIAATLGSGTLTAEQVRKVLLLHLPHREYYSVEQTDAWREIADELNAELGSGKAKDLLLRTFGLAQMMYDCWVEECKAGDNVDISACNAYSYEFDQVAQAMFDMGIDPNDSDYYRSAELGSGTCELTETDSYSNANEVVHVLECSACGETCEHVNGSYPRCPNCGRKAVER